MGTTVQCHIYARFSPRPDADTSDSADKQVQMCREYAARKGYQVVGVHTDKAVSRNSLDRPALMDAIVRIKRGHVLLCYELSRFGAGGEAVTLEGMITKKGGRVEFVQGFHVSDSPDTKMVRNIMYEVKDYERAMIGQRTGARMRQMQRGGKRVSAKPPYGYRAAPCGEMLEPEPVEQPILGEILKLHGEGHTPGEIARKIEKKWGETGRRGKRWYRSTVRRIINRECSHV